MAILIRSKAQISGLVIDLATLQTNIDNEATARSGADGTLNTRITTEVGTLNTAISTLDGVALKKASNLSDLADAAVARTNLSVNSKAEVDAKITAAKLALGTNHVVADIAARNALIDMDVADTVFVTDDGDTKWAIYRPAAVDGTGAGTAWVLLSDEDTYLNANSAPAIKASYESNADTNAFTDAEQAKVGFVSVTAAIDLDKVIQSDELITDVTLAAVTDTQIASAAAVKAFVLDASNAGGAVFKTESLAVAADKIVLAFKPKDGMILNFGTVRHIDSNSIAYDIPVVADGNDATGKTYTLLADSAGQFDTKSVTVQYPHTL